MLDLAVSWLPVLSVVVGGLWAIAMFFRDRRAARRQAAAQNRRERRTRLIEAQKPFLDEQLKLYFETAGVVGRLVQSPRTTDQWRKDHDRFWELYWSQLSMVEHKVVEKSMVRFGKQLKAFNDKPTEKIPDALTSASLDLAHAFRRGIQLSWGSRGSNIVAP